MLSVTTPGIYDWPDGDQAGGGLVEASRPGYRQVVRSLRDLIRSGKIRPGAALTAQSALAAEHRVSVAVVNAAVTALAAEGLVQVERGRQTTVLGRLRWAVEFQATGPAGGIAAVRKRLRGAAAAQPMISKPEAVAGEPGLLVRMIVESADAGGAVTAALPVAREALGALPVTGISVAAAE